MKPGCTRGSVSVWLFIFSALCLEASTVLAAVSLSISPSIVTNDFEGKIVLTITGLTNRQTVTVQSYVDINGNGSVDAGEPLTFSMSVTDGKVSLVGGVRNLNVPGDEDGLTNGQIRLELPFPTVGGNASSAPASVFRVSDPAGVFASVTQTFRIVQKMYAQAVAGRLTSASSGLPLTNTFVVLVGSNGGTVAISQTDANGNYFIYTLAGVYGAGVVNVQGGLLFDGTRIMVVPCGQSVTNNIAFTQGTIVLAGKVTDAATGQGIPGLALDGSSTNGLGFLTFTDASGNYTAFVTPNTWSLHPSTDAASQLGYVPVKRANVMVSSVNVSNVNFSLNQATALLYGSIKDSSNNPVHTLVMSARDQNNNYRPVGRTLDAAGNYSLGVLAATWAIGPDSAALAERGLIGPGANIVTAAGQATNVNFTVTYTNLPGLQRPLHLSASQFEFLLTGLTGQGYKIQAATNLNPASWFDLLVTNLPCDSILVVDGQATNGTRFYRAGIVP